MSHKILTVLLSLCGPIALAADAPPDARFLDHMTQHHMQGIEIGKMAKAKAQTPDLKKMADQMVSDQQKEVAQMKEWRRELFPNAERAEEMQPMDLGKLQRTRGSDFDAAFIDLMAEHHAGGIRMADEAAKDLKNPQLRNFAAEMEAKQRKELGKLTAMKNAE